MPRIIAFDVNETLLNTHALAPHFKSLFGDESPLREWFALLLLHSQSLTLAGMYFDFSTLAGAVLEMLAAGKQVPLTAEAKVDIVQGMLRLPPFPEVRQALELLRSRGLKLITITNSKAVEQQIHNAGLTDCFDRNFSVDTVQRYKPAPEPYRLAARQMGVQTSGIRMVAAHGWDILGAMQAGCAGAFVKRPGKALFPLAPLPDVSGKDLLEVAAQILEREL
jgi:2-haloacid dehalogenase